MGRRVWVVHSEPVPHTYSVRVLSFKAFLPAEPPKRQKHLVQIWTDPGGMRTLTVGSIKLKDPGRVAAGRASAAAQAVASESEDE